MADHQEDKRKDREQKTGFFVTNEAEKEDVEGRHVENIRASADVH